MYICMGTYLQNVADFLMIHCACMESSVPVNNLIISYIYILEEEESNVGNLIISYIYKQYIYLITSI